MKDLSPQVIAALISAGVTLLTLILTFSTKNFLEKKLHMLKLEADHQFEQRKKIKSVLAKYKIHLINSCESLNARMWNFANNHQKGWMNIEGNYNTESYYFPSFIYRILSVYYWIKKIEDELIFLDSTISTKNDLEFIKFLKLFQCTLTDIRLYNELYETEEYEDYPMQHFYFQEL